MSGFCQTKAKVLSSQLFTEDRAGHAEVDRAGIPPALFAALVLAPCVAAIWAVPWFVTQDGPLHVYNAQILRDCLASRPPFSELYAIRPVPFPNWTAHVLLTALLFVTPPRAADCALMTLTLLGPACAMVWLRTKLVGREGALAAALLAALVSLNLFYLAGFYGFSLGTALFPITLGYWWTIRGRLGPGSVLGLAALLLLGYFCHPVSLAATGLGLLVLALFTREAGRVRRLAWTAAAFVPLVPLAALYRAVMRGEGAMQASGWWQTLAGTPWYAWLPRRLTEVNLFALSASGQLRHLTGRPTWPLPAPAFLLACSVVFFMVLSIAQRSRERGAEPVTDKTPWAITAALLILAGLLCPENFGPAHGRYLDSRLFLLGVMAVVPILNMSPARLLGRVGAVILALAFAFQLLLLWDYAFFSNQQARPFLNAKPGIGRGKQIATVLLEHDQEFGAVAVKHLDTIFGADNLLLNNFEATSPHFPVKLRDQQLSQLAYDIDFMNADLLAGHEQRAVQFWRSILERHRDRLDLLVLWGHDPELEQVVARWYEPVYQEGRLTVVRRVDQTRPLQAP